MTKMINDMADYIPDQIVHFDLGGKVDEVILYCITRVQILYEDITEGGQFKGSFFLGSSSGEVQPKIDFYILSPNKRVIYSKRKSQDGVFNLNITETGQYSIVFSNMKAKTEKKVTFTV